MDAVSFAVLRRALACLDLAADPGRGLDALLGRLFDVLAGLPGFGSAAVVLADAEERPAIRAQRGAPDMGLVLTATLDRGEQARRARVLRRGAGPVVADEAGEVSAGRDEAAMLAAPVLAGESVVGWFFADGLLGGGASLADDLRLAVLVADIIGRMASIAAAKAAGSLDMAREVAFLRSKVSLRYRHVFSDGASPALSALRGEADRAALSDAPLLLLGEPGSGRATLARIIHELSSRATRPFSTLDLSTEARPAERLFGTSRSLASGGRPGGLEEADGGTLLLEEAHRLPPDVCERLAQFLRTGTFTRVGGSRERGSATRLVFKAPLQGISPELTATVPLATIEVPSLRERREDIAALLDHLLTMEASRGGRRLTLTSKALRALEGYDWPGNIREMEGMVARLAVTAPEDRIDIADIPSEILAEGERPPVLPEDAAELRDMERQQVLSALERHGWVQSRAARELGLTLRQIGYRIRKYGLVRDDDETESAL
ncbi:sigma54 specific transcriptional regulator, Fis family [Solidesulfovibrio carbinoliphilus subsp. oakridgensis]|uniref:Sigma54 specific transcriptional regulator, Fis family n=1 Tax=Solidesulfovibrio carbinoliphilus subsp. oakridgensis TaxID=694327 RepID=G7Q854_9BACT|nr:sigma 54-interacting transcriptional regulator [Solidesulfovibrio carbinoliphilus]EHJ48068.1 sigma54 specific transcriptional regulator, Fis family [Solidesulfovibrio carbinoliphilus subsp. oakridgensis]